MRLSSAAGLNPDREVVKYKGGAPLMTEAERLQVAQILILLRARLLYVFSSFARSRSHVLRSIFLTKGLTKGCLYSGTMQSIRSCKWVDEVVEDVPYVLNETYLNEVRFFPLQHKL
jgi:hypothetical protein